MLSQILIINENGLPVFNWQPEGSETDSALVSGFLSALNMFASGERGEQIRKITMSPTTFFFDRDQGLIFVILTQDPDFEKIIQKILVEVKTQFMENFLEAAIKKPENVEIFTPFKQNVINILTEYGYFDYLNLHSQFINNDALRGILFIDPMTGKSAYSQAKEFFDRDKLGSPCITLLKTAQRLVQATFQEELEIVNVISNTMRVIALRGAAKMTFLAEIQHGDTRGFSPIEISEKKKQTILKKQGNRLFLEEIHPFIMFDMNGKILLSNVSNDLLHQQKSPVDCITLLKTGENAITQIFKEKFFAVLLCAEDHLYLVFSLGKDCVLMLFPHAESPELKEMVVKLREFVPFGDKDKQELGKVLRAVHSFQKRFV